LQHSPVGLEGSVLHQSTALSYPHYIDSLGNLIPFGGLFPPIHAHPPIRKTRLLRRNKGGLSGMSNYDHRIAPTVDFS
ncbi:MAG: hypothetical protein WB495_26260, partial [Xanthobacteraceae bacterium]